MARPEGDRARRGRVHRLRADWRKADPRAGASGSDADANRRHDDEALGSNDRIRDEAPDDLETRRRADELEREIKRSRPRDRS